MRVLIIGGTAFIGPQVVVNLVESGHEVTLFHRSESGVELPPEVRHVYGNRRYLDDFRNEFTKLSPEVVLDMVALCERDAKMAVEVFRGIAGRLVTVSSQDVYRAYGKVIRSEPGPYEPTPIREDSSLRTKLYPYREEIPRDRDDPYKYLDDYDKIPVEQAVMCEPQLPGTIARLPMVYGQRDSQHRLYNYLKRMDDQRPVILLDSAIASWSASRGYVENVGAAIAKMVTDERAQSRIYNVADSQTFTMAEWVKKIGEAARWPGQVAVVPRESLPAQLAADMDTNQDLVVDTSRIRSELDHEDVVPVEEALLRTVAWERRYPPTSIPPDAFDYSAEDAVLARLKLGHRGGLN